MSTPKVLFIGQAPPAQPQSVAYDTTQLYDWFKAAGLDITPKNVWRYCRFEALCDTFPGWDAKGGHKQPSAEQKSEAWDKVLRSAILESDTIVLVGAVAQTYITESVERVLNVVPNHGFSKKRFINLLHPSTRNISAYRKNAELIHETLKSALPNAPKIQTCL